MYRVYPCLPSPLHPKCSTGEFWRIHRVYPSYFYFCRSSSQTLAFKSLVLTTVSFTSYVLLCDKFPKQNTIPRRSWSVSVTLQPSPSHMRSIQLTAFQTLTPNQRTRPAFCLGGNAWISHLYPVYLTKEISYLKFFWVSPFSTSSYKLLLALPTPAPRLY